MQVSESFAPCSESTLLVLKNKPNKKNRLLGAHAALRALVALRGVKASASNQLELRVEAFERCAFSTQGCVRSQQNIY